MKNGQDCVNLSNIRADMILLNYPSEVNRTKDAVECLRFRWRGGFFGLSFVRY